MISEAEALKLIAIMQVTYAGYYKNMPPQHFDALAKLFISTFEDYTYEEVDAGLRAYLTTDVRGYPPTPGQIINSIHEVWNANELSIEDAWYRVVKAIKDGSRNSKARFDELPIEIQQAVGNAENIFNWSQQTDGLNTFVFNRFAEDYKAVLKRKHMNARIPKQVKETLKPLPVNEPAKIEQKNEPMRPENEGISDDMQQKIHDMREKYGL